MSSKVTLGGLILSLVLNLILFGWLFQLNSQISTHIQETNTTIADLQSEILKSNQSAEEARTIAANLQTQVENTGTLTRFAVTAITEQLTQLVTQTITLTVPINQQIPVATSVQLDETFEVPIQTTVPISTVIDVPLQLGILGEVILDVPINLSVPIDLVVNVPFREEIPINTTVPIVMDIPVVISLKDTPLATQLEEWQATLGQFGVGVPEEE
jgi:hypothetical protein